MNNDVVVGINEEDLSNLSLEVLDYVDRISEIFDKIDSCFERLPNHYQGSSCVELLNLYDELSSQYSTIKNNFISYSDDFISLIRKMQDSDKLLTTLFQDYTDDTVTKIKSVNK